LRTGIACAEPLNLRSTGRCDRSSTATARCAAAVRVTFFAATACARDDLHLKSEQALRWYASSPTSRRGFCGQCGSQLFWDSKDASHVSVLAGSLNTPTGLTGQEHIFVADAGDYYTIDDGLPQKAAW